MQHFSFSQQTLNAVDKFLDASLKRNGLASTGKVNQITNMFSNPVSFNNETGEKIVILAENEIKLIDDVINDGFLMYGISMYNFAVSILNSLHTPITMEVHNQEPQKVVDAEIVNGPE